jgi:hypothetical protein
LRLAVPSAHSFDNCCGHNHGFCPRTEPEGNGHARMCQRAAGEEQQIDG